MTYPRALRSPVMAMARPRRPVGEIAAVQEAADEIRKRAVNLSDRAVSWAIAKKVIDCLLAEHGEGSDFASSNFTKDAIKALAFGEGFGAVDDLCVAMRHRISVLYGVAVVPEFQQTLIRKREAGVLTKRLAGRYAKQLRSP